MEATPRRPTRLKKPSCSYVHYDIVTLQSMDPLFYKTKSRLDLQFVIDVMIDGPRDFSKDAYLYNYPVPPPLYIHEKESSEPTSVITPETIESPSNIMVMDDEKETPIPAMVMVVPEIISPEIKLLLTKPTLRKHIKPVWK